MIPTVAGPARMVPLAALVRLATSLNALRDAARRWRVESFRDVDGPWRSSRHAIDRYFAAKFQRTRHDPGNR